MRPIFSSFRSRLKRQEHECSSDRNHENYLWLSIGNQKRLLQGKRQPKKFEDMMSVQRKYRTVIQ